MVKIWCEWDMGFSNVSDYYTVVETKEEAIKILEEADWDMVGFNTWQEVEDEGLLSIEEMD